MGAMDQEQRYRILESVLGTAIPCKWQQVEAPGLLGCLGIGDVLDGRRVELNGQVGFRVQITRLDALYEPNILARRKRFRQTREKHSQDQFRPQNVGVVGDKSSQALYVGFDCEVDSEQHDSRRRQGSCHFHEDRRILPASCFSF